MVKEPMGARHKTRKLLRKSVRERGAIPPLSLVMHEYKVGDKVHIKIDPSVHSGMPHKRYHGMTGTIIGKRGSCYLIEAFLGDKRKVIIARPEHLRPVKVQQAASSMN